MLSSYGRWNSLEQLERSQQGKTMGKYFEVDEISAELWHYATCQSAAVGMKMLLKPVPKRRSVRLPPGTERKEAWRTLALELRRTRYERLTPRGAAIAIIRAATAYRNGGAFARNKAAGREPALDPERSFHIILMLHSYASNDLPSVSTLQRLFAE